MRKLKVADINLLLAIFITNLFVFYHLPLDIFITNEKQLYVDLLTLAESGLILAFCGTLALYCVFWKINRKLNGWVSVLFIGITVWFFINTFFSPTSDDGQLMGEELIFDFPIMTHALSIFCLGFILVGGFSIFRKKQNINKGYLIVISLGMCLYPYFTNFIYPSQSPSEKPSKLSKSERDKLLTFSNEKNILLILLDSIPDDRGIEVLERAHNQKTFRDFTYYEDVVGASPQTSISMPLILSGQFFRENTVYEFSKAKANKYKEKSFINKLSLSGWRTATISYEGYRCANHSHICAAESMENLSLDFKAPFISSEYIRLLNLSLLKLAPVPIKKYVYNDAEWVVPEIDFSYQLGGKDDPTNKITRIRMERIQKFNNFLELIKEKISVNDQDPVFKYWHFQITHPFFNISRECQAVEWITDVSVATNCAFIGLQSIFNELRRLGIYDKTAIIVASDHGIYLESRKVLEREMMLKEKFPDGRAFREFAIQVGTANPLLLFKNFDVAQNRFVTNSEAVHSVDIARTVCDLGQIRCPDFTDSISLVDPNRKEKYTLRKRIYVNHKWGDHGNVARNGFHLSEVGGPIWDPESWRQLRQIPPR